MSPGASIAELVCMRDYQRSRVQCFQTTNAIQYFVRQHKPELVEVGALLFIQGQWFVDPRKFDNAVMTIGSNDARRKLKQEEQQQQPMQLTVIGRNAK